MDNRHTLKLFSIALAIVILSSASVLAFGISSPYWKNNALKMQPGQVKDVFFNLQNCPALLETCNNEDVNVVVTFEEGSEIAQLSSGTNYLVPYGTRDTNINLKVSIPSTANVGDSFNIKFSLTSPPEEGVGTVQLGVKYNVDFPVQVVEDSSPEPSQPTSTKEPQSTSTNYTLLISIIIIIMIVTIIIVWLFKRKNNSSRNL
jgi:hypothetical protein